MGKIHWTKTWVQRFALLVIASVAAASPIEDTADVAAAKAEFNAAFARAEAGRHIELAPMNNDVQAAPIASACTVCTTRTPTPLAPTTHTPPTPSMLPLLPLP